jgi:SAM-dependent methyltransferase
MKIHPDNRILENLPASFRKEDIAEMAIPSYFHANPFVRYIISERLNEILRIGNFSSADSVLDFGTGSGLLLPVLSKKAKEVIGTDLRTELARRMLQLSSSPNARIIELDEFERLPAQSISKIVAADVLEHIPDLGTLIDKFTRLLQSGGKLIVSGPTETGFYKLCRKIAGFRGDYHVRCIFDIEKLLAEKGYRMLVRHLLPRFLPFKLFEVLVYEAPTKE